MKIYVTGVGLISAAGKTCAETLESFKAGERRTSAVSLFSTQIKSPAYEVKNFSRHYFPEKLRTLNLCLAAIEDALTDAGLKNKLQGKRIGIAMGTTVGSILNDLDFYRVYREKGKSSMESVDRYLQGNLASAAHAFLKTEGPSMTVVNACASGTDAIGIAMSWIKSGLCDIAIAGGSDEMNRVPLCGFGSLGILSESLCAPFDKNRTGLNLGEGAGALVLEGETSLQKRAHAPRAAVRGYGTCNDAHHLTSPDPQGIGLEKAITSALHEARVQPSEISFINAHGTGTQDNDLVEGFVLNKLFGPNIKFLSTKGYTGHALGAAGGLEAGFCILALESGWIPQSAGFKNKDPQIPIAPVTKVTPVKKSFAVSTSLGFGGCNAALVIEFADKAGPSS